ncbi:MAG: hypothetical protein ACK4QW_03330 [Alphaproteobacteria bacterium]
MWPFYQELVALQREIYLSFGDRVSQFAATGDWGVLATYLPMGILFGAAHALMPGHSKAVLATYLTGSTRPAIGHHAGGHALIDLDLLVPAPQRR